MKAGRSYGGRDIRVETIPDPEPGEGEVLIAVKAAGICGSELHGYRYKDAKEHPPITQGHEISGRIVALGAGVETRRVGDRVAVEPLMPCLSCDYCLQGKFQICRTLQHMQGGFAELLVAKERNAHLIPDNLSFDHAAMSEVYAVAVHALSRVAVEPDENVVVIGSGPIGLTIAEMAAVSGAGSVIVLGKPDAPLRVIEEMIGAKTVNVGREDAKEAIATHTDGKGADVVFEAVGGLAPTLAQAMEITAPGGRIGMAGAQFITKGLPIGIAQSRELSLHGVFCYGRRGIRSEFDIAIDLQARQTLQTEPLITHRFPLDDIAQAFETADNKDETGSVKVIVNP